MMKTLRQGLVLALGLALHVHVLAQDAQLRQELFFRADAALAAANEVRASVLAPASYGEASELYRRAEQTLSRGRSLQDIRRDLAEAVTLFEQSVERAGVARVTLNSAFEARGDALAADAENFAAESWRDAEVEFAEAANRLENGNINRARRAAGEAEQEYRAAELEAIETNYFAGARDLIARAERERVDRSAPKSLARAKDLLARAEAELRRNRYDTDLPRSLAREARYEAQHSFYLAQRVEAVDDKDLTVEDLLIQAEEPLSRIGGQLDQVIEFDQGVEAPTALILEQIAQLQSAQQALLERNEQVAFLESELSLLEGRLGEESERRRLQEQIQQRFEQLATVFTRDEATVLRSGDDVIVRLGLNFDSGSDVIQARYYSLLRKIQTAIDLFPDSTVEVAGHTDSFGDDAFNQALSERRANAVREYLQANMTLGNTTLKAVGFGETVPLANNETVEGRARNRRIDLMIQPNMERLRAALAVR